MLLLLIPINLSGDSLSLLEPVILFSSFTAVVDLFSFFEFLLLRSDLRSSSSIPPLLLQVKGDGRAPLPPPAVRPPVIIPATMLHGGSGRHGVKTGNIVRRDAHQVRISVVLVKPRLNAPRFFS